MQESRPIQPFSAVVLAGGRSRRMGRDKARILCGGVPLIERQLRLLRQLGAQEVFIASRAPEDYPELGARVVADVYRGRGPLAGLERALETARHPLVLVLAVDLPRMTARLLTRILRACGRGRGIVPRLRDEPEPLAACYPRSAHALLIRRLDSGQNGARAFALDCADTHQIRWLDILPGEAAQFANWNRPEDVSDEG